MNLLTSPAVHNAKIKQISLICFWCFIGRSCFLFGFFFFKFISNKYCISWWQTCVFTILNWLDIVWDIHTFFCIVYGTSLQYQLIGICLSMERTCTSIITWPYSWCARFFCVVNSSIFPDLFLCYNIKYNATL